MCCMMRRTNSMFRMAHKLVCFLDQPSSCVFHVSRGGEQSVVKYWSLYYSTCPTLMAKRDLQAPLLSSAADPFIADSSEFPQPLASPVDEAFSDSKFANLPRPKVGRQPKPILFSVDSCLAGCLCLSSGSYIVLGFVYGWQEWTHPPEHFWPIQFSWIYWEEPGIRSYTLLSVIALLLLSSATRLLRWALRPNSSSSRSLSPLDNAGFFSIATFWWVQGTLSIAAKQGRLEMEDLPALAVADQPERLNHRFSLLCDSSSRAGDNSWRLLHMIMFRIQRPVRAPSCDAVARDVPCWQPLASLSCRRIRAWLLRH